MCGIFAYLLENGKIEEDSLLHKTLIELLEKIRHRGPDNTQTKIIEYDISGEIQNVFLGFHRLAINGLTDEGNQPMELVEYPGVYIVCNGEIYNYKEIGIREGFNLSTGSDCEIIIHLYMKYGFEEMVKMLDGYFGLVLVDTNKKIMYAARDLIGVRSLFIGYREIGTLISSEMKALSGFMRKIEQFPPGHIWDSETKIFKRYSQIPGEHIIENLKDIIITNEDKINEDKINEDECDIVCKKIKELLTRAVKKRFMSDRPIGCLLSGGLDSSLITSIVHKIYKEYGFSQKLKTFSVGLEGSTDLKFARMVSEYLDTDHTELILTEEEMLEAIPEVVKMTETYDTTTIRASTPMYLLCKHIKETTDITVLFSGEGSDEASGSYLYFHNAPSVDEFHEETRRLLKDLSYFDVLRCDKSTAGAGLEVRVPFLDRDFLDFYMSIPPRMKIPSYSFIEKYLLRKAFDSDLENDGYLPYDVLWRQKEGMSDGVSSKTRGWFQVIQEHVQKLDSEGLIPTLNYNFNPPLIKESEWYRQIFNQLYPGCEELIPYYWLPRWCGDVKDPSARVLKVYKQDN